MFKNKIEPNTNKSGLEKVNILGVDVAITSLERVLKRIDKEIKERTKRRPFLIVTINPEFVMQSREDPEFRDILNGADLAIPDGWGLVWASGGRIAEPVAGRKVVERLAGSRKYRVFYLGGRGGAAGEMVEKYGGEWDEGEKDIKAGERENARILSKINKFKPDVLLVAYGAPWQEKWIWGNLDRIQARLVMGVGGTFDYLTGRAKLPPGWMERVHLEWLWRLVHEPWRWRRQARLIEFMWKVVWS